MKKTFLAALLIVAFSSAALADGKNKMLGDLKAALKNSHAVVQTTESYSKATFAFNNSTVSAYFDPESEDLIGFGIPINANDLPQGAMENISKKFEGWTVSHAIMFIDANGNTSYYAQVDKGDHSVALSVSPKGKVSLYAQMPK